MSNTESLKYRVVIDAGNDMVEIIVVDGRFNKVESGIRKIETALQAGRYLVKTRIGDSVAERFIAVPEQSVVNIQPETLVFDSAIPVLAAPVPEVLEAESRLISNVPVPEQGEGVISVFVRGSNPDSARDGALSLYACSGAKTRLISPDKPVTEGKREPITGFSIKLASGGYILQSSGKNGAGAIEMMLWVSEGFETRVYLEYPERDSASKSEPPSDQRSRRKFDLSRASIAMLLPGTDITSDAASKAVRALEMARTCLIAERPIMLRQILETSCKERIENPMLVIFAAHLTRLGASAESDLRLLTAVTEKLEQMVPGHPDVKALQLWLGDRSCLPIDSPPMLKSSWAIIAEKTAADEYAVREDSLTAWVGPHVTASRPWLVWRGEAEYPRFIGNQERSDVNDALKKLLKHFPGRIRQERPEAGEDVAKQPLEQPAGQTNRDNADTRSVAGSGFRVLGGTPAPGVSKNLSAVTANILATDPTPAFRYLSSEELPADIDTNTSDMQVTLTGSRLGSTFLEALRDSDRFENDPVTEIAERLRLPRVTVINELRALKILQN
ncbi:hypothetical protein F6R98_08280 [Candidatus Methylospira mobilis]|uniref:Uncharacterized protein n=1 Tax=Candidatus Methylospira mobilis TaxID=1808979 RepID=A0A5Q0BKH0_9GAMM|nr:hypothetical protein [Candidatus Methylospira mobilis]QFY42617.1 hypothetical protein F6R98_08280 [Candidatus Methylospira mobilis]WNV04266.1 hypothetical protein RP726_17935 [Candidatus Methylospira mobilis]